MAHCSDSLVAWLGGLIGPGFQRVVLPLMSVKRKVTVPVGRSGMGTSLVVCERRDARVIQWWCKCILHGRYLATDAHR